MLGRVEGRLPSDRRVSTKERRVIELVAAGLTDRQVGLTLHLSEWTVRYHLRRLFVRRHVRCRAELVASWFSDADMRVGR